MSALATRPLGAAAALLSSRWSRPTAAEVEGWQTTWRSATAIADELGSGQEEVRALAACARCADRLRLEDEYERLFVGPGRTPCPPYESLWRSDQPKLDQGRLLGSVGDAVVELYRDLGLTVGADAHELPEHVAVEFEALALAATGDGDEAQRVARALLDDHLRIWLAPFCAAVQRESAHPFYSVLPALTLAWTELLGDAAP